MTFRVSWGHTGRFKVGSSGPHYLSLLYFSPFRAELQNPWSCSHIWMDLKEHPYRRTFTLTGGIFGIVTNQKRYFRTGTQINCPAEHWPFSAFGTGSFQERQQGLWRKQKKMKCAQQTNSWHKVRLNHVDACQILGKQNLTLNIAGLLFWQH